MKKIKVIFILLLFLSLPLEAGALSERETLVLRIKELQAKIEILQKELQLIRQTEETLFYFEGRMELGDRGQEVRRLQQLLNRESETRVGETGPGSPGNETDYFGPLTQKAVIRFQEKYRQEILTPWGFNSGTGIVGATTRKKLNQLLTDKALDKVQISSNRLQQGDTLRLEVESEKQTTVSFLGREVEAYPMGSSKKKIAFLPVNTKDYPGFYSLVVRSGNEFFFEAVRVAKRNFPVTELKTTPELEEKGYTPEGIRKKSAQDNKEIFDRVLGEDPTPFYFNSGFTDPLETMKDVGNYGNIRRGGGVELQHLGVDLDAEMNTPIYSINEGLVVFIKDMSDYGKTMIVDHGGGIRSLYIHLEEFLKKEGDRVKKGETIALSGNSGYSLAPHLHLTINIHGQSIDPLLFLEAN